LSTALPLASEAVAALVVGAGPAGLAVGRELRARGIEPLIVERGDCVGASFAAMPQRLRLVSPWHANRLPGRSEDGDPCGRAGKDEYAAYLRRWAETERLPVRLGTEVRGVRRAADGTLLADVGAGTIRAQTLVCATGYFAAPFTPLLDDDGDPALLRVHFAAFGSAERLRARVASEQPRVLVVGKRLSAGQAIVELVEDGWNVDLCARSEIRFASALTRSQALFCVYPFLEALRLRIAGPAARPPEVPMESGGPRSLICAGRVQLRPAIERIRGRRVDFADGGTAEFDVILFATGFRPALGFLREALPRLAADGRPSLRGMESADGSGIFFLGLDCVRSFRSRFLRGIREDAPILAAAIRDRLHGT
jgi:putative flavoprotein involved in K+ transport